MSRTRRAGHRPEVQLDACFAPRRDERIGQGVGFLLIFVGGHRDHQVLAGQRAGGPVHDAVAVGILEAQPRQQFLGGIRRVRIVHDRVTIVLRRTGVHAAGEGAEERAADDGLRQTVAVGGMAQRAAEFRIAEEFTHGRVALVLHAQTVRLVEHHEVGQRFGAPTHIEVRIGLLRPLHGLDVFGRRILDVRVITTAGQDAQRAARTARPLLIHGFVNVRELLTVLVHLPVVRVAAHDQQFVGLVFGGDPGPHRDLGNLIRGLRVLEFLVVHVGVVLGMERLEDVGRHDVEISSSIW